MERNHMQRQETRRELLRKMAVLGLALPTLPTVLSACGTAENGGANAPTATQSYPPDDPRSTRRTVFDVVYTLDNDYYQGWDKASQEMSAVYNLARELHVSNGNIEELRTIFTSAATRGVEGIVNAPANAAATPGTLGIAERAGIHTATAWSNAAWSTPLDVGDHFVAYHTGNDVALASSVCEILFEKMGGQGKFIHIEGIRGYTASDLRTVGVDRALASYPRIQMVAREEGGFSRTVTQPVIENLLTAHPDVAGIMCQNDDSAIAVINALERRGMQVPVVGIDVINEFLEAMQRGDIALASAAPHGSWLAAWSMVKVFDAMNGFKLSVPERMMYFGAFVVDTPEAAEAYQKLMYKADKLPYDYERWSRVLYPDDWDPQNTLRPIDPTEYWEAEPMPAGYALPSAYEEARAGGDFARITGLYADKVKNDPWKDVRKLCDRGGVDIL